MITVDGLVKRVERHEILRGVSFAFAQGSIGAVLGPSGAGKTTLLRCLVGLEPFDAGRVRVDDVELAATPGGARAGVAASLRGRVGLVFQSFELFPHLTVLENCVLAPVKVRGLARAEAEARAAAWLARLGLADKHGEYPERLSGGQRQRVAIARALVMEPRVLFYDEPTSALDPALRREVGTTFARVAETGITQIMVTHDLTLAREVAAHLVVLDRGTVADTGTPDEVLGTPRCDTTRRLVDGEH